MLRSMPHMYPVIALVGAFALVGCQPKYPSCKSDEECSEQGEYCVNGQCQECSTNAHCDTKYPGEKRTCNEGRCDAPAKACTSNTECGAGQTCTNGACKSGNASTTHNLSLPSECQADTSTGEVRLQNIPFAFNEYNITTEARHVLEQNLACLQKAAGRLRVILEGHADERGTQEYNLALGDKRAHTIRTYLKTMGISIEQLQTRSKGENEPLCNNDSEECFARNRRVVFIAGQ